jgi:hypothetical protein
LGYNQQPYDPYSSVLQFPHVLRWLQQSEAH